MLHISFPISAVSKGFTKIKEATAPGRSQYRVIPMIHFRLKDTEVLVMKRITPLLSFM